VTGLLCVPWFLDDRSDDRDVAGRQMGTDLGRKIEAIHTFADTVIAPTR
jgi:hypothetical protein